MATRPKTKMAKKPKKPSKADAARAQQAMQALGVGTLYGTGDGQYFRSLTHATHYAGDNPNTLITYSLDHVPA